MLYTDDDVLLADNQRDVQLFTMDGRPQTSGSNIALKSREQWFSITVALSQFQSDVVKYSESIEEYKYLGVWMNEGLN